MSVSALGTERWQHEGLDSEVDDDDERWFALAAPDEDEEEEAEDEEEEEEEDGADVVELCSDPLLRPPCPLPCPCPFPFPFLSLTDLSHVLSPVWVENILRTTTMTLSELLVIDSVT